MIPAGLSVSAWMASLCLANGLDARAWQWLSVVEWYEIKRAARS